MGGDMSNRRNTEEGIRLKQSEFWNEVGRKWNRRRMKGPK
jgi:hypothetical protein